jgi:hypothetical protein
VIAEAGNDPKVAGLVYVAAFAPDGGGSVSSLIKDPPPGAPVPPILPPQEWIARREGVDPELRAEPLRGWKLITLR